MKDVEVDGEDAGAIVDGEVNGVETSTARRGRRRSEVDGEVDVAARSTAR